MSHLSEPRGDCKRDPSPLRRRAAASTAVARDPHRGFCFFLFFSSFFLFLSFSLSLFFPSHLPPLNRAYRGLFERRAGELKIVNYAPGRARFVVTQVDAVQMRPSGAIVFPLSLSPSTLSETRARGEQNVDGHFRKLQAEAGRRVGSQIGETGLQRVFDEKFRNREYRDVNSRVRKYIRLRI